MHNWERQKGEKAEHYEAFLKYRDSKLEPPANEIDSFLDCSADQAAKIIAKYNWKSRRAEFREFIAELLPSIDSDNADTARMIDLLIRIINKRIKSDERQIEELKIDELLKLAGVYTKTMSDAVKLQTLSTDDENDEISDFAFETIAADPATAELAEKLLERLSKVRQKGSRQA